MRTSVLSDRLRPGRDANDTSWVIQRYAADWQAAQRRDVVWNPVRGGVEMAPLARPELAADWLPLAPVTSADGVAWRADPERNALLRRGPCDEDFTPVAWVGGSGMATGRFNTPTGVSLDGQGRLYVADSGNGRVQVLDPRAEAVVAVLSEALARPVHTAIGPCGTIYVADPGKGAIVVFTAAFAVSALLPLTTRDPQTGALWVPPPAPRPLAVDVLADGTLTAFDPRRPELWHMTADGAPLDAHPWPADLPPGWMPADRRFAGVGEVILGPLDGGAHDLAWHRVLVEAEMPDGTALTVQTFATNDEAASAPAWAPRAPVPIPAAQADRADAPFDRLVLADGDAWELWRLGRMRRAEPDVAQLEGAGPVNAAAIVLPGLAAAQVMPGDRLALVTPGGGRVEADVTMATRWTVRVAAQGGDFSGVPTLLARDGAPLPFGPLTLDFLPLGGPLGGLAPAADGRPEDLDLPHALAAFLRSGDVLEFPGGGRIEVAEVAPPATVTLQLDTIVGGDFSTCTVTLIETANRLVVQEPLPDLGVRPAGSLLNVIADAEAEQREVRYVDAARNAIWLAGPLAGAITPATWTNASQPEPRASDKGRYLWVRLVLHGASADPAGAIGPPQTAQASPLILSLRVTGPRPSLSAWLPKLFNMRDPQVEPPGALFLERYLALFEGQLTRMEEAFDSVSRLLNPEAADAAWLRFIAAWQDFTFDPSWPIDRRRQLVLEGARIQRAQGTPGGLIRYLEIYTGQPVAVVEAFRARPPAPMALGQRGALGVAPMGVLPGAEDQLAHRFKVTATLPGRADRRTETGALRRIIDTMKPAHTAYTLDTERGPGIAARVGMDTAVDSIVIPAPRAGDPCACDPEAVPGPRPQPGQVPGGFRLGGRLGRGPVSELNMNGG